MPLYDGDKDFGASVLASNAVKGFLRAPRIELGESETPTGTPVPIGNGAPIVIDTTGRMWVWVAGENGGWRTNAGTDGRDGLNGAIFTARGPWATGNEYVEGDVVERQGNGYACIDDHTATSSNAPSGDAITNDKWNIIVRKGDNGLNGPIVYRGEFFSTSTYNARELVRESAHGRVYYCRSSVPAGTLTEIPYSGNAQFAVFLIDGATTAELLELVRQARDARDSARDSAGAASDSAGDAAGSARAAGESASTASDKAGEAVDAAGNASGYASNAVDAKDAAVGARDKAIEAKDAAEDAEERIGNLLIEKLDNPTNQDGAATDLFLQRKVVGTGEEQVISSEWVATTLGTPGNNAWTPKFAVVIHGVKRVVQITDWVGGTPASSKPDTGYVGGTGVVQSIDDATDIRGATGMGQPGRGISTATYDPATGQLTINFTSGVPLTTGSLIGGAGNNAWTPKFTIEPDGTDREVVRITDWVGGSPPNSKPDTGYLGGTGIVDTAAAATNIRGSDGEGTPGRGITSASYSDTTGRLTINFTTGVPFVSDVIRGNAGNSAWTPVFAVEEVNTAKAVLRITDWTGGTPASSEPNSGYLGGSGGVVSSTDDATNIRGPAGQGGGPDSEVVLNTTCGTTVRDYSAHDVKFNFERVSNTEGKIEVFTREKGSGGGFTRRATAYVSRVEID